MEEPQDLLTSTFNEIYLEPRIRLIPLWIKIFTWLFLVVSFLVPVCLIGGILDYQISLSLYGFGTTEPFSAIGIGIMSLFLLKGIIAYGILSERKWAIRLGIADGIIGIAACIMAMVYPFVFPEEGVRLTLRLELIALIPYLITFLRIRSEWEREVAE